MDVVMYFVGLIGTFAVFSVAENFSITRSSDMKSVVLCVVFWPVVWVMASIIVFVYPEQMLKWVEKGSEERKAEHKLRLITFLEMIRPRGEKARAELFEQDIEYLAERMTDETYRRSQKKLADIFRARLGA